MKTKKCRKAKIGARVPQDISNQCQYLAQRGSRTVAQYGGIGPIYFYRPQIHRSDGSIVFGAVAKLFSYLC